MTPRKDTRKGNQYRQKTGARERNCKPKVGEKHSRVAKGTTSVKRLVAVGVLLGASLTIIALTADDATGVGAADDVLIVPTAKIWWDATVLAFG